MGSASNFLTVADKYLKSDATIVQLSNSFAELVDETKSRSGTLVSGDRAIDIQILIDCIIKYLHCIIQYAEDGSAQTRSATLLRLCNQISIAVEGLEIKNEFIKNLSLPTFEFLFGQPSWIAKEILRMYSRAIASSDKAVRSELIQKKGAYYLGRLIDALPFGDFEFQTIIVETLYRICTKEELNSIAKVNFLTEEQAEAFYRIKPDEFDLTSRHFLNLLNDTEKHVVSLLCYKVTFDDYQLQEPPELSSFQGMWVDFNVKANTVTLFLNNKPFNSHFTWETITLFPENILKTEISYLFNAERGKKEGLAKFILKRQCQLCYATEKHELLNCRLLALHSLDTEKFREIFNQVFPKIHKVKPKQSGVRVLHCKKVYKPLDIVSVRSSTTNPSTTFNVTMDSSVADKERQSNVGRKLANVATSSINSTSSNTRSISSRKSMNKTSLNQSIQAEINVKWEDLSLLSCDMKKSCNSEMKESVNYDEISLYSELESFKTGKYAKRAVASKKMRFSQVEHDRTRDKSLDKYGEVFLSNLMDIEDNIDSCEYKENTDGNAERKRGFSKAGSKFTKKKTDSTSFTGSFDSKLLMQGEGLNASDIINTIDDIDDAEEEENIFKNFDKKKSKPYSRKEASLKTLKSKENTIARQIISTSFERSLSGLSADDSFKPKKSSQKRQNKSLKDIQTRTKIRENAKKGCSLESKLSPDLFSLPSQELEKNGNGGLDKVDARHIKWFKAKSKKINFPRLQKITDFSLIDPVRTCQSSDFDILKLERTKNSILENPIVEDLPEPDLIQFSQPKHQELHTETEIFETAKTNLDSEEEAEIHSNGIKFELFQDISQENEYVEGGSKENSQEANFDLNKEYKAKVIILSNIEIKSPIFKSQLSKEKDQKDQVGDTIDCKLSSQEVQYSETQKSDSPTPEHEIIVTKYNKKQYNEESGERNLDKKSIDEDRSGQSFKSNNKSVNEDTLKTQGNKYKKKIIVTKYNKKQHNEESGERNLDKKNINEDRSSQSLKSNNKMSNEESKKTRGRDEVSVVQTKRKLLPDQKKPSKVRKSKMSKKIGINERTIPSSDSDEEDDKKYIEKEDKKDVETPIKKDSRNKVISSVENKNKIPSKKSPSIEMAYMNADLPHGSISQNQTKVDKTEVEINKNETCDKKNPCISEEKCQTNDEDYDEPTSGNETTINHLEGTENLEVQLLETNSQSMHEFINSEVELSHINKEENKCNTENKYRKKIIITKYSKKKYNEESGERNLGKKIIDEDRSSQSLKSNNKSSNEESKETWCREDVSVVKTKQKILPYHKKPSKVRKSKMSNKIGINERTIPSSDSDEEDDIPLIELRQYLIKNKVAENKKPRLTKAHLQMLQPSQNSIKNNSAKILEPHENEVNKTNVVIKEKEYRQTDNARKYIEKEDKKDVENPIKKDSRNKVISSVENKNKIPSKKSPSIEMAYMNADLPHGSISQNQTKVDKSEVKINKNETCDKKNPCISEEKCQTNDEDYDEPTSGNETNINHLEGTENREVQLLETNSQSMHEFKNSEVELSHINKEENKCNTENKYRKKIIITKYNKKKYNEESGERNLDKKIIDEDRSSQSLKSNNKSSNEESKETWCREDLSVVKTKQKILPYHKKPSKVRKLKMSNTVGINESDIPSPDSKIDTDKDDIPFIELRQILRKEIITEYKKPEPSEAQLQISEPPQENSTAFLKLQERNLSQNENDVNETHVIKEKKYSQDCKLREENYQNEHNAQKYSDEKDKKIYIGGKNEKDCRNETISFVENNSKIPLSNEMAEKNPNLHSQNQSNVDKTEMKMNNNEMAEKNPHLHSQNQSNVDKTEMKMNNTEEKRDSKEKSLTNDKDYGKQNSDNEIEKNEKEIASIELPKPSTSKMVDENQKLHLAMEPQISERPQININEISTECSKHVISPSENNYLMREKKHNKELEKPDGQEDDEIEKSMCLLFGITADDHVSKQIDLPRSKMHTETDVNVTVNTTNTIITGNVGMLKRGRKLFSHENEEENYINFTKVEEEIQNFQKQKKTKSMSMYNKKTQQEETLYKTIAESERKRNKSGDTRRKRHGDIQKQLKPSRQSRKIRFDAFYERVLEKISKPNSSPRTTTIPTPRKGGTGNLGKYDLDFSLVKKSFHKNRKTPESKSEISPNEGAEGVGGAAGSDDRNVMIENQMQQDDDFREIREVTSALGTLLQKIAKGVLKKPTPSIQKNLFGAAELLLEL